MFHTIHESITGGPGRGPEIARTDNWAHAYGIASVMSKAYPEFLYTCVNGNVEKITQYKGGECVTMTGEGGRDILAQTNLIEQYRDFGPCASNGRHNRWQRHNLAQCIIVNGPIIEQNEEDVA